MSRSATRLAVGLVVAIMGTFVWAGVVSADVVLCKSAWSSYVKARHGSCRWREKEILLPDTLADLDCSQDEIARYDGTQWVCSEDGTADLQAKVERLMECFGTDRYLDLGLTVFDCQRWLEWEKKTAGNVDDQLAWSTCTGPVGPDECPPDGTAFEYIAQLNTEPCFADRCDWRLPEVNRDGGAAELETIVDLSQGVCGGGSGGCIDPIFGPTAPTSYWSSVTIANFPTDAWLGIFGGFGGIGFNRKTGITRVRAVRTGP